MTCLNSRFKSIKGAGFSLDAAIEASISNVVCFEFFTYFAEGVRFRKRIAGDMDKQGKNWASATVDRWNDFLKNNRDLRIWYASWIEQIKNFEEQNLVTLKQTDFLAV